MQTTYDPHAIEQRWYQTWEQGGYFKPSGTGKPYCIMIPPPNITGTLHMGHAFQDLIMDALTRYHRMRGDNTLWQPGTDHAGIATQMVVERQLNATGKTRHDLGRDAFIERIWQWKKESGGTITSQLRRMGASVDWSRERFTMDEGLSTAVNEVFVKLFDEGLIYRGKRLVNWDPVLHTALSDLEVLSAEETGKLWHLRYPLSDGSGHLIVATTRPETMLGDTAVAVHPDDERYQNLIGKTIKLPLTDREIPIIADSYVDPEFGTGCVKITPAHDFNDYEIGLRHQLPVINLFTINAQMNDEVPVAYRGMDRFVARKQIVKDFEALELIEKIDAHKLMVPRGDRSGAIVEPYMTDQWYVNAKPLAETAVAAVRDGRIKFVPENWSKTYYNWMEDIQDWCISRQIWWGHRIPAWYDEAGKFYVAESESAAREKYKLDANIKLRQDDDVLDTWFSSALWPYSTLGWPDKTKELETFYPTSVLVTGFDIIFFWVARMIMMGMKFMDQIPFHEVYIHGLVRDADGQKMSKSKGNVLDPLDLIDGIGLDELIKKNTGGMMQAHLAQKVEKNLRKQYPDGIPSFGTDALRFTFAALASTGRDISFDLKRVESSRNFCNKLWNASRYVLMNTEGKKIQAGTAHLIDRWINSQLQATIQSVNQHIQTYRFDLAAQALYEFTWNEYCDWYLELCKSVLADENSAAAQHTRYNLLAALETLLRLMHPFMPYITEELWQQVAPKAGKSGATIMLQEYPEQDEKQIDQGAEEEINWIKTFVLGIRRIRAEMDISPGKPLDILFSDASKTDLQRLTQHESILKSLARLNSIKTLTKKEQAPESAMALVGNAKILIPLAGLIDVEAEKIRLNKEISKREKEIERLAGKLNNASFIEKAPANIVATEQARLAQVKQDLHELSTQLIKIKAMK